MVLKVGDNGEPDGMTAALEDAFERRWLEYCRSQGLPEVLPELGAAERRMIFATVAEGVIRHISEQLPESMNLSVSVIQGEESEDGHPLESHNDENRVLVSHETGTGYFIEVNAMNVRQTSGPVVSNGDPQVDSIDVEDL